MEETVICNCKGEVETFTSIEEAKGYYGYGILYTTGDEQKNYRKIYKQLELGFTYCSTSIIDLLRNIKKIKKKLL